MFIWECIKNTDRKGKLLNCLSFATLFSAFVFIVILTYWSAYPYKPLVINKQPFHVISKEVKAGGILNYEIDYCKNTTLVSHISRSFVNGLLFTMPVVEGANKLGCGVNNILMKVPEELPAGEYTLEINYKYQVNPIREISVKIKSEPFRVIGIDVDKEADIETEKGE